LRYGERGIEEPAAALAAVREVPGVRAASPFTYNEVLLTAAGRSAGTVLRGIDLASAVEATDFRKTLRGASAELTAAMASPRPVFPPEGIVLGSYLASSLGVSVGSPVDVLLPLGGDLSPLGVMPRMRRFTVVGIFQVGFAEFDSKLAMVAIPTAQQLFRMGPAVSGIEVRVTDIYRAAEVAETVRARLKFPYFTRTWMELNRNFFSALRVERIVMFVILTMIVLVAAFGIISTLIMLVMQKRKEIAVLKSMGATGKSLMAVFIVQGMIIGAAGTILGLLAGLSIARNLDPIVAAVEWVFGFKAFPQEVYLLDKLPARILWPDVVAITVTAFVISFLATIIPSRQAARVDPVVAIRYE
ncbi:MAG: ABC transporter permease, partial [candidate division NC10 bacterium]